ncbi:MAG: response regulator [Zetaproteobacteria bacterium]|nr:response regulator [Zetaproteobacteria bacterium]
MVTMDMAFLQGKRGLLIDDDDAMRLMSRMMLDKHGVEVFDANSGQAALTLLQEQGGRIDFVLQDLSMPGMNGIECAREIQKINADIQIILVTGHAEDRIPADDVHFSSYLLKPYLSSALYIAIAEALGQNR